MENKNKRMCNKDVEELIKARITHKELFKQKFYRRDDVWLQIQTTGKLYQYSLDQLRFKWNYLFKKYKELTAPSTGIGTEDGKDTAETWKWYAIMHEFCHTQHMISPLIALSSVRGCTIINHEPNDAIEMVEEYLEDEVYDSSPFIDDTSTQSTSSASRDSTTLSLSSVPSTSSGVTSSRTSAPRGRRRPQKNQSIVDLLKKEAKRSKKEGKCILQFLNEYSKKSDMQFNMPSSSESD